MAGNSIGSCFVWPHLGNHSCIRLHRRWSPRLSTNRSRFTKDLDRRRPGTSRYTTARRTWPSKDFVGVCGVTTEPASVYWLKILTSVRKIMVQSKTCLAGPCGLHLRTKIRPAWLPWWWPLISTWNGNACCGRRDCEKYLQEKLGVQIHGCLTQMAPSLVK